MDSTPQPPHPSALLELYCTLISLIKQEVSLFLFNWICLKFPLRFLRMLLTTLDRLGGGVDDDRRHPAVCTVVPLNVFGQQDVLNFWKSQKKPSSFFVTDPGG